MRSWIGRTGIATLGWVIAVALSGCQSKQDAALEHAKQQAASTGQPQQIASTDKDGNAVTTVVQPPAAGQKEGVVTTTVTPKPVAAAAPASAPSGSSASAPNTASTAQAAPPAPPPAPKFTVTTGTALVIRIDQRLSAKHSRPGEKFTGELTEAVAAPDGMVVIPKGSRVTGKVDESKKRGNFKGAGELKLRLTSLTLNGKQYPLATREVLERMKGKGKRTAGFIGGGTGLGLLLGGVAGGGRGALIGGLAGAGAGTVGAGATGNKDVVIPAESVVHFTLADDLIIDG